MAAICGFRPTGELHIGHFFSVVVPGRLPGVTTLVADFHAAGNADHGEGEKTIDLLARMGVRELVRQKDLFRPMCYFRLLELANIGHLERMTQYKASGTESRTAHLLTYPVLMTHDVMGFDEVLVGSDQTQHVEYSRDLIQKFNRVYGTSFALPVARPVGGRVMDLREPTRKMSKSHPDGCLFLRDTPDQVRAKLRQAVTDDAGRANLVELWKRFTPETPPEKNLPLKEGLAELFLDATATARD